MKKNKNNNGAPQTFTRRKFIQEVWRNYRRSFGAMFGLLLIVFVIAVGVWGNIHYDYETQVIAQNIPNARQAPSLEHWFGTDELGRDIFIRVIYASRYSITIAFVSVIISTCLGVTLGAVAGYYGGILDTIIMRITDIFGSLPSILFGMTIVAAFGQNIAILMVALAISGTPAIVRVSRASVMTVRGQEFIEAAKATGVRDYKIILEHVLPNALSPILVQCTLRIGTAITGIAALSFMGMGVSAPMPEWGAMLSSGRAYIRGFGYMTLFPGLAIMLTVLGFNMVGDGLRDAMDPKLKR